MAGTLDGREVRSRDIRWSKGEAKYFLVVLATWQFLAFGVVLPGFERHVAGEAMLFEQGDTGFAGFDLVTLVKSANLQKDAGPQHPGNLRRGIVVPLDRNLRVGKLMNRLIIGWEC